MNTSTVILKSKRNKSIVKVMIETKKYKSFAKIQLQNRWKVPVIITVIILLVNRLLNLPSDIQLLNSLSPESLSQLEGMSISQMFDYLSSTQTSGNATTDFLLTIIQLAIQFILTFGAINVYLAMSRSPEQVPFSSFLEGLSNWSRGLLTGLYCTLRVFLWALISIPIIVVYAFIIALFSGFAPATSTVVITTTILMFLGMIPAFIKSISYSQMMYIAAEYQNVSIKDTLTLSIKLTEGHKVDIVLAWLSFIGWFLLSFITLGIADLWITPYFRMTMTNVYHALLKEALENGKISPEDLKQECEVNQEMDS